MMLNPLQVKERSQSSLQPRPLRTQYFHSEENTFDDFERRKSVFSNGNAWTDSNPNNLQKGGFSIMMTTVIEPSDAQPVIAGKAKKPRKIKRFKSIQRVVKKMSFMSSFMAESKEKNTPNVDIFSMRSPKRTSQQSDMDDFQNQFQREATKTEFKMRGPVGRATLVDDACKRPVRTPKAGGLTPIGFDLMKDRINFSEKKNIDLLRETVVAERISKTPMGNARYSNQAAALPSLLPKLEIGPRSTNSSGQRQSYGVQRPMAFTSQTKERPSSLKDNFVPAQMLQEIDNVKNRDHSNQKDQMNRSKVKTLKPLKLKKDQIQYHQPKQGNFIISEVEGVQEESPTKINENNTANAKVLNDFKIRPAVLQQQQRVTLMPPESKKLSVGSDVEK